MKNTSDGSGVLSSIIAMLAAALIAVSGTAHATLIHDFSGGMDGVSGYYAGPDNGQYNAGAEGFTPGVSGSWTGHLDTSYGTPLWFGTDTRFTLTADPGCTVTLLNFQYGQWSNGHSGFTVLDHSGKTLAAVSGVQSGWMTGFAWPPLTDNQLTIVFDTDDYDNSSINNITFSQQSPPALILSYGPGAVIDKDLKTIAWTVPYGTDLATLTPTITVSSGDCVPASGNSPVLDRNNQASYTVTDTATATENVYTLTVTVTPASTACGMLSFGENVLGSSATIDSGAGTVAWAVPYGTAVTELAPTYTVSRFATCSPAPGTGHDFTNPQKYTVTAQDGSSAKDYFVTVTVRPAPALVIYEPFAGASGPLNGQPAGTGLTGNWWGNDKVNVTAGSLSYGNLLTSGNHAVSSGVAPDWWNNGAAVSPGTTLSAAGLLAPGAELWFSFLVVSYPNHTTYVGLGKNAADGWGRLSYPDGTGIGVKLENGQLDAYYWDGGWGYTGTAVAIPDGVNLVVGKIVWGASTSASATLSIYLPGTDLALPATTASAITSGIVVDQSTYATISFANGNGQTVPPEIDEIRFGARYIDVVPATASDPDYDAWAAHYPGSDLSDPAADLDGDGLTNEQERIWGLDPTRASSANPYAVALNPATGTFSYTRRNPALSGLTYTVWTSTTLAPGSWTEDLAASASQVPGTPDANDIETVAVTLSATPVAGKLFVRVQATK